MRTGLLLPREIPGLKAFFRPSLFPIFSRTRFRPFSRTTFKGTQSQEMKIRNDANTSVAIPDVLKIPAGDGVLVDDYVFIEEVEQIHRYQPGGYHPVSLGDRLHDRYRIVHKLGFGGFSTIWLAEDETSMTLVAVKICVAMLEEPPETDLFHILHHVDRMKNHPGEEGIQPALDSFTIQGPNGTHHCFVTTPARTSIPMSREASYYKPFQPAVARSISAQLVQTVAFLHSLGIVHADLHEGNILLRLSDPISNLTIEQIHDKYGQPRLEPVQRWDKQPISANVPTHMVLPAWFGRRSDLITLAESSIFLSDFGESFRPATTVRHHSHTPYVLRPPEHYFDTDSSLSYPSDVWALACTIFSIQGGDTLFETWFASDETMIQDHVESLGRLPSEWWTRWQKRDEVFDENLNKKNGYPVVTLEDRFEDSIQRARLRRNMPEMDEDEKKAFLALMRSMLAFKPEDRPSVEEVLQSDWMINWAMKDLERARQLFPHSR